MDTRSLNKSMVEHHNISKYIEEELASNQSHSKRKISDRRLTLPQILEPHHMVFNAGDLRQQDRLYNDISRGDQEVKASAGHSMKSSFLLNAEQGIEPDERFEVTSYAQLVEEIETKSIVSSRHHKHQSHHHRKDETQKNFKSHREPRIPHLSELFLEGAIQAQYPPRPHKSRRDKPKFAKYKVEKQNNSYFIDNQSYFEGQQNNQDHLFRSSKTMKLD